MSKSIFRRMILILCGLIIGLNVYLWNANKIGRNPLPMPFDYGVAVVLSGSMEPAMSVNDLVFVKKTDAYEVGDVIVYQNGYELIMHRVMDVNGEILTTQGDANNTADPPVQLSAVKGEVIGFVPFVGNVVLMLKTPAGTLLALIAAILLLKSSYQKERQRDEDELEQMKEEIRKLQKELNE